MSRPTSFAELIHSAPVLALLRALRARRAGGALNEAEHVAEFRRVLRLRCDEGLPCDACGVAVAFVIQDGRLLCAACALAARAVGE